MRFYVIYMGQGILTPGGGYWLLTHGFMIDSGKLLFCHSDSKIYI